MSFTLAFFSLLMCCCCIPARSMAQLQSYAFSNRSDFEHYYEKTTTKRSWLIKKTTTTVHEFTKRYIITYPFSSPSLLLSCLSVLLFLPLHFPLHNLLRV